MNKDTEFEGHIRQIYYMDPDSDFAVFNMSKNKGGTAKVKGDFPMVDLERGTCLKVKGTWNKHPEYGWTMKVDRAKEIIRSEKGIRKFLKENVHQIGPKTADKLITQFGTDLIDLLNEDPDRIAEQADYLRSDQREELLEKWEETKAREELLIYLYGLGLSSSQASFALNQFGLETRDRIEQNPFCLLNVTGVGYQTCDKVAAELGFATDSDVRVRGAVIWTLMKSTRDGHLYVPIDEMRGEVVRRMKQRGHRGIESKLSYSQIEEAVEDLEQKESVVVEDDAVYLSSYFHYEDYCADRISDWSTDRDMAIDVDTYLTKWEDDHGMTLSSEQRQAVYALNETRFLVVAGLPGTGKTTIVKALTGMFEKAGMRFHLMSPTGIAAKRLHTVTGHDAQTIHRQLGYKGDERWQHNRQNKLDTDAVIVDEASMVSQELFFRLVSALKENTTLVMVGDHAQLPSVGAGNVLEELLDSDEVRDVRLTKIFRQEEASDLVINAHRINDGESPELVEDDPDFRFIEGSDKGSLLEGVLKVAKKIEQKGGSYQVLSPRYAGMLGVDNLNERLREVINPKVGGKREHEFSNMLIRDADRMMVTENDYDKEVFNGEICKISGINPDAKKVRAVFPEPDGTKRKVRFEFSEAATLLTLAYCTTVHKCQGQEYDYIVFPFVRDFGIQLQRNLFYTAITRAKKKVFILGEWSAVTKAIRNKDNKNRNTRLAEKIEVYS